MHLAPLFGISIDPSSKDPGEPFYIAQLADEHGLDLITIMDHPYNARLFDTWTLLAAIGARTERIRLCANVLNLPLRPPAMIAKMVASLDVLTGGRADLGIGAGGYWDGIEAFGGERRTPGEAFGAFRDALRIIRGLWDSAGRRFSYDGEYYQVNGARFGPAPAHPISIWVGGYGPRMLDLTGRMADGLLVSRNRVPPDRLLRINERIDLGAEQAGRSPSEIRRGYNLMGVIHTGGSDTEAADLGPEYVRGTAREWAVRLLDWYRQARQDTFIFWPVAGNQRVQIEAFASEVMPAVREALAT